MNVIFSEYLAYSLAIVVMMLFSFFFSGTETALITSSPINLEGLAGRDNRQAQRALYLLENIESAMSMILIGNNIVNIAASAFVTFVATKAFAAGELALFIITVAESIVFLIFCEVAPKVIARAKAERFLMAASSFIIFLMRAIKPAVSASFMFSRFLKKIFFSKESLKDSTRGFVRTREEIDVLFGLGVAEGLLDREHKTYVSEILTIKDISAREIMTPITDIVAVELRRGLKYLVGLFASTKFSRILIYDTRPDNIVGYVFYRDLLKRQVRRISEVMRPVQYVPLTKRIVDLYDEMVKNLVPLVMVVDEYGGIVGMVTHEDIAEEVVGEIHPKDQSDEVLMEDLGRKRYRLSGKMDIEFFSLRFKVPIEKKGFETLAGYIEYCAGRIPKRGERINLDRYVLTVDEATSRSVDRVIIQPRRIRRREISGRA